jgi:uncharacterized protein DUF4399
MNRKTALLALLLVITSCASPPESRVFFESPEDGAEVVSPVQIHMGATGVAIVRAGVLDENSGHFHILVDEPFVPAGVVVPSDSSHRHFGDASTTATLELAPGEHVLRLQLGDGTHAAMEGLQDEIRITVR